MGPNGVIDLIGAASYDDELLQNATAGPAESSIGVGGIGFSGTGRWIASGSDAADISSRSAGDLLYARAWNEAGTLYGFTGLLDATGAYDENALYAVPAELDPEESFFSFGGFQTQIPEPSSLILIMSSVLYLYTARKK